MSETPEIAAQIQQPVLSIGQRRWVMAANFASAVLIGLAIGGLIPLLALFLELRQVDPVWIGANGAMASLGIFGMAGFVPRIVARFGAVPTMVTGLAVSVSAFLAMPFFDNLPAWFALRFILGMGVASHWIVSESWVNAIATKASRGRVMAIYAALLAVGFAMGPAVLTLVGSQGWLPFLIFAAAMALTAIPLLPVAHLAPKLDKKERGSVLLLYRHAPTVLAAAMAAGLYEAGLFSFLPLYGLRLGLTEADALYLLTAFIFGNVVLQIPIGWLADKMNRRLLMLIAAGISFAGPLAMPWVIGGLIPLTLILVVWGGFAFGIYSVGLAMLGDRYEGGMLTSANAAFVQGYVIANILGNPIAGAAMRAWEPHGLMVFMAGVALVFALVVAARGVRRRADGTSD